MIEGFTDPILINRFSSVVTNAVTSLRQQASRDMGFDPRRSIADECGFPSIREFSAERLKLLYDSDSLAARVVDLFPRECWQVQPEVYESEDGNVDTSFEQTVANLNKALQSEVGYHNPKPTEGNRINEYLQRADIECGKGRYGIILIGIDDGQELHTPVQFSAGSTASRQLIYLRVFPEVYAQISQREPDRKNPRFGQPTLYNVTFDLMDDGVILGMGPMQTGQVHWTRIVHVVDNPTPGEVLGTPRIMPVLYDLLTAQKSRWGSGEVYWKNALQKISFETHPQLGGDVQINPSKMKTEIEKVMNGLQQYWTLIGMTAKPIVPASIDPTQYIDACINSICIKMGVPVRIFKGSERGELASAQDDDAWNDRLKERQNRFITPRIIAPFYDRLINLGVLPIPQLGGYTIDWEDLTSQSASIKATIGSQYITALSTAVTSGLTSIIPIDDILVKFVGWDEKEAQASLDKQQSVIQSQAPPVQQPVVPPTVPPVSNPNTQPTDKTGLPNGQTM